MSRNCPGANCPWTIVLGGNDAGVNCQGDNYLGENCQGENYQGGDIPNSY